MIIDLGIVKPGATIRIPWSSFAGADGSQITVTNYAAADLLIYKDGGTTERASAAGITATTDFDSKTGKQLSVIDLADNTTAGFYSSGSEYNVAIDAVTIDGASTGGWIGRFKIGYPNAALDTTIATLASQTSFTLTNGPAEDDALNGFTMMAHDVASAIQVGMAYVSDYTGSTKTVTLAAGPTFTMAATDNVSFFTPIHVFGFGGTAATASGGRPEVNTTHWLGTPCATPTVAGVPEVDATHFAGTAYATALAAEIDAVWDETLTGGNHNVANSAGRRLRTLQTGGNYEGGLVWVDTTGGTAGTTVDENGVVTNPVDSIADALTIAVAANLSGIHIAHGNSITLAATVANYSIVGDGFTLALGGQSISGTKISGASTTVSGTATGTFPFFHECGMGAVTLPPCALDRCGLQSTLTVGSAGDFYLIDCFSQIAGSSSPVIDFGAAVGATNMTIRRWSGGLTLNNLASGDVVSVDVVSGGTITLNGADATVVVRGTCNVVNNLTGSPTVTTTSVLNQTVLATPTNITAGTISTVSTLTGHTPQTGDVYALANGASGFVATKADTAAILLDTGTDGVVVADKTGYRLSSTGVADVWAYVVEGTWTAVMYMRLIASSLFGKISGAGTNTVVIRDVDDTKNRISATVDVDGNRSAFGTRDGT